MNTQEMLMSQGAVRWRKSTRSSDNGQCVEVGHGVGIRDSKNPDGGVLPLTGGAATAFVTAVKAGKFDA